MLIKIGKSSIVESTEIGDDTEIGEFVVIKKNARIGRNVKIHDHVIINSGVIIGDHTEIFPFTYLGKEPKGNGVLLRNPHFETFVLIGNNNAIGPHATIYYNVSIGEHTLIGDNASIRELSSIGNFCIIARNVTVNYNAHIGNYTKIMDGTHITGNCKIGNHVFIGMLVSTSNDNSLGVNQYIEEEEIGPTIQDNAMIGEGVSILPRIKIGKGSIIGAGSVVTKEVKDETVVMGVPAVFKHKVGEKVGK